MSLEPKVTIITLSWNRKFHTLEWLEAVTKLEYPNYDILVVDNGSTDGSPEAIRKRLPGVTVLENGENLGYARGFNIGLEHAFRNGAHYALIMNNDAVIDPEALDALVEAAESDTTVGFVSGKVLQYFRPDEIQSVGMTPHRLRLYGGLMGYGEIDRGQYDETVDREITDDVFLLVRKAVFDRLGGYDEDLAFYGPENVDWCLRVRNAGFRIVYAPKAKLWHKGRVGVGWMPLYIQYQIRNDFVLISKHMRPLKASLAALMLCLYYQPKWFIFRVRPTKLSQVSAYLRGQAAGLAWLLRRRPARATAKMGALEEKAERP